MKENREKKQEESFDCLTVPAKSAIDIARGYTHLGFEILMEEQGDQEYVTLLRRKPLPRGVEDSKTAGIKGLSQKPGDLESALKLASAIPSRAWHPYNKHQVQGFSISFTDANGMEKYRFLHSDSETVFYAFRNGHLFAKTYKSESPRVRQIYEGMFS